MPKSEPLLVGARASLKQTAKQRARTHLLGPMKDTAFGENKLREI